MFPDNPPTHNKSDKTVIEIVFGDWPLGCSLSLQSVGGVVLWGGGVRLGLASVSARGLPCNTAQQALLVAVLRGSWGNVNYAVDKIAEPRGAGDGHGKKWGSL